VATLCAARALSTLGVGALFLAGCSSASSDDTANTGGAGGSAANASAGTGMTSSVGGLSSGAAGTSGALANAGAPSAAGQAATNAGAPATNAGAGGGAGRPGMSAAGAAGHGAAGASGQNAGAAGSSAAGAAGTPGLAACPTPPTGTPDAAVTAIDTENAIRVAMQLDCAAIAPALCTSAQNHCNYYTENEGTSCQADSPHDEIAGCPGFTGAGLGDRFKAAGYTLRGSGSECMAFLDDPAAAVMTFVNSVYHRTSILDPWMRDFGYGGSTGCDTIDFGTGTMSAATITAFYPYADQTGLPTSFDGSTEGPEPPTPPSGWPSGYPVTLYAMSFTADTHTITVDGDDTPLTHEWLAENDTTLPDYAKVLYTDAPLTANTTYHVVISGSLNGSAKTFDWKFTTGAATGGGRPRQ
jgi:hypothetical protein